LDGHLYAPCRSTMPPTAAKPHSRWVLSKRDEARLLSQDQPLTADSLVAFYQQRDPSKATQAHAEKVLAALPQRDLIKALMNKYGAVPRAGSQPSRATCWSCLARARQEPKPPPLRIGECKGSTPSIVAVDCADEDEANSRLPASASPGASPPEPAVGVAPSKTPTVTAAAVNDGGDMAAVLPLTQTSSRRAPYVPPAPLMERRRKAWAKARVDVVLDERGSDSAWHEVLVRWVGQPAGGKPVWELLQTVRGAAGFAEALEEHRARHADGTVAPPPPTTTTTTTTPTPTPPPTTHVAVAQEVVKDEIARPAAAGAPTPQRGEEAESEPAAQGRRRARTAPSRLTLEVGAETNLAQLSRRLRPVSRAAAVRAVVCQVVAEAPSSAMLAAAAPADEADERPLAGVDLLKATRLRLRRGAAAEAVDLSV